MESRPHEWPWSGEADDWPFHLPTGPDGVTKFDVTTVRCARGEYEFCFAGRIADAGLEAPCSHWNKALGDGLHLSAAAVKRLLYGFGYVCDTVLQGGDRCAGVDRD